MKVFSFCNAVILCFMTVAFWGCNTNKQNNPTDTTTKAATNLCSNETHISRTFPNGAQGLRNCASLQKEDEIMVINLGNDNGFYAIDMDFVRLFRTFHDYTLSIKYFVGAENDLLGYGHFAFACSALAENTAEEGPYIAFRLNEQRYEVTPGGYNHEVAISKGEPAKHDVWQHAIYRQKGHRGELFIDGELIGVNEEMPCPADIFQSTPENCWVGRAPFRGDRYLTHAKVAELVIFNYAISDEEMNNIK